MKPYFSLQRVLELKERREQATAQRLAAARQAAEAAREALDLLADQRRRGEAQRAEIGGVIATVGQLQNASYVLDRLDQRLEEAATAAREAEAHVNVCFAEFTIASRERQMLDRLKERKAAAATAEEAALDRKTMDAVALTRFTRGRMHPEGSTS
ncbi:MAG: flagellar export protein FliJ [Gemmatimonadota bacterium]